VELAPVRITLANGLNSLTLWSHPL